MTIQVFCLFAAAGLLAGCAGSRQEPMGGSTDTDQNVLTGGPKTGTSLQDLPTPVRDALQQRAPHAEVADIDKMSRSGQVSYQISFSGEGKNPTIYIFEDGRVATSPEEQK